MSNNSNPEEKPKPFLINRDKCALLCIDMQNDFVEKGAPMDVPGIRETTPKMKKLQETCRELGVPVIHTRWLVDPKITPLWMKMFPELKEKRICFLGTHGAETCDELEPEPGEYVVDGYTYDKFQYTNLEQILNNIRGIRVVDTVIICGTVTNFCVMGTARTAHERGFKMVIAGDGVSAFSPEVQKVVLDTLDSGFGRVMTTEEIIKALREGEKE